MSTVVESPTPVVQETAENVQEEEYSYSDYSYSDEEDDKTKGKEAPKEKTEDKREILRQAKEASSKEGGLFSNILKSSKKLFDELSNAGLKTDSQTAQRERVPTRAISYA